MEIFCDDAPIVTCTCMLLVQSENTHAFKWLLSVNSKKPKHLNTRQPTAR